MCNSQLHVGHGHLNITLPDPDMPLHYVDNCITNTNTLIFVKHSPRDTPKQFTSLHAGNHTPEPASPPRIKCELKRKLVLETPQREST